MRPLGNYSQTPGSRDGSGIFERFGSGSTPSPFYNISNQFAPRNYHDVLKWVKFITVQSPMTTEVLRKYATYPITEFVVETDNAKTKENYKKLIKSLDLKSFLKDVGFDYYSMGNVFISVYFPIIRMLHCKGCGQSYAASKLAGVKFKNYQFRGTCPKCHHKGDFEVRDQKSTKIEDLNLVKWDPENISVDHNPITGRSEYYYQIPNSVRRKIQAGDPLYVNTVPWGFITAVRDKQDFKFDAENIFHMKTISMGSHLEGLGMPPLVSLYSLVFYQAVLRRANEAIASEYLTPLRAVFPSAGNGGNDPITNMSMQGFASTMEGQLRKHKQDPNHIMVSPIPIGYQNLGGEGRNLLVAQEIDQAEQTILMSLGVSKELLSGTTNWTSSTVGLRLLENSMQDYVGQMDEFVDWAFGLISSYMSMDHVDVNLTPFKLTDDDSVRQVLVALLQQGKASMTSLYETLGMDYGDELERIKDETIDQAVKEIETQEEVEKAQFLSRKKQRDDDQGNDGGYQETLAQARTIAQQILSSKEEDRQNILVNLQAQDSILYQLVVRILQKFNETSLVGQNRNSQTDDETEEETTQTNQTARVAQPEE